MLFCLFSFLLSHPIFFLDCQNNNHNNRGFSWIGAHYLYMIVAFTVLHSHSNHFRKSKISENNTKQTQLWSWWKWVYLGSGFIIKCMITLLIELFNGNVSIIYLYTSMALGYETAVQKAYMIFVKWKKTTKTMNGKQNVN